MKTTTTTLIPAATYIGTASTPRELVDKLKAAAAKQARERRQKV